MFPKSNPPDLCSPHNYFFRIDGLSDIGKEFRQNIQKAVIYIFGAYRDPPKTKTAGVPFSSLKYLFRPQNFSYEKFFSNRIADNDHLALGEIRAEPAKDTAILLANFPAQTLVPAGHGVRFVYH